MLMHDLLMLFLMNSCFWQIQKLQVSTQFKWHVYVMHLELAGAAAAEMVAFY